MIAAASDPAEARPVTLGRQVRQLIGALQTIEALPAEATGALVAGDPHQPVAAVLVERGRICWVAVPGMRRRLTDLLRGVANPPLNVTEMEAFFQGCRERSQPLGEALVSRGRLSAGALRASLCRHSAESLLAPEVWRRPLVWVAHRARGYQPTYTFQPTELLADAGLALSSPGRSERVERALRRMAGLPMAVFAPAGSLVLGLSEQVDGAQPIATWVRLGRWAGQALAEAENHQVRFAPAGGEASWVAWTLERLVCAAICATRSELSCLIANLDRRGLSTAARSAVPCP